MEPGGEARGLLWHLCELSGVVLVYRRTGSGDGRHRGERGEEERIFFFFFFLKVIRCSQKKPPIMGLFGA